MKAAIVGADGYIARNLINKMKDDNRIDEIKLYGVKPDFPDGDFEYTQIDATDYSDMSKIDFGCDVMYVLTGKTGTADGFDKYEIYLKINELALLNIIKGYREAGSKAKLVFPSTRLLYKGDESPLKETAEKEFKTVYAINKFACEQYLEQAHLTFDLNYCVLRICVPYGTAVSGASSYGTAEFMLNKARNGENITIYGDGSQRRTFTYIENLISIMIEAGLEPRCINDVYNVGGEALSLQEVANIIAQKYRISVENIAWPKMAETLESGSTVFDASKLEAIIGRKNTVTVADWIKTM